MSKILIIVEGIADVVFLRDYIKFLKSGCTIDEKELNKKKYIDINISENIEIKILVGGGYTAIENLPPKIKEYTDQGYKISIIQDADNPKKENGGVENRIKYLEDIKNKKSINFSIFLFPNNKDDGDLETLLLRITNKTKYDIADECYEKYIECTSKFSNKEFDDELREDKSRVFNYFRTYYGMDKAKEQNRYYEKDYWDFNHKDLEPLKDYINSNII